MKKFKLIIYFLLCILSFTNVYAYSNYIIPGGENIGINIKSEGILVVGFYKINGNLNKGTPNIKVGDQILEVENIIVNTNEELVETIKNNMHDNKVNILVKRNNNTLNITLPLIYDEDTYKTGLYIKDEITGIGTLSYIDPNTHIYGALGHEIIETNSKETVEVKTGNIFRSYVTGIDRSVRGTPGGKNARFYKDDIFGDINKNTINGIYGTYTKDIDKNKAIPIKSVNDIKTGKAYIYTVLNGEEKEKYEINITKIDKSNNTKNIYFDITDVNLLEKTGGIVQGMSGSPIIQDDTLVGAVTHVVVSNPTSGYGISIISMLEEGEK